MRSATNSTHNTGEAIVVYGGNLTGSVIRAGTSANDGLTGTSAAENFAGGRAYSIYQNGNAQIIVDSDVTFG